MANEKLQKLPNGKWEYLVDEKNDLVIVADTAQEAERMAQAYFKGDKSAAKKRIARREINKPRSSLI
jgi:hypothetical protein